MCRISSIIYKYIYIYSITYTFFVMNNLKWSFCFSFPGWCDVFVCWLNHCILKEDCVQCFVTVICFCHVDLKARMITKSDLECGLQINQSVLVILHNNNVYTPLKSVVVNSYFAFYGRFVRYKISSSDSFCKKKKKKIMLLSKIWNNLYPFYILNLK